MGAESIGNESCGQAKPNEIRQCLADRYDGMWSRAVGRIESGNIDVDPLLASRAGDRRRCYTVLARPAPSVCRSVMDWIGELRQLEPEQYYYASSELHVTVLSLFTATTEYEPFFAREHEYIAAADAALDGASPISIEFYGVTASPGAILVQGFFKDSVLNQIRDRLRRELRDRGLAETIDARYKLETAHMTAVRFRSQLKDGAGLAAALARGRSRPFGTAHIDRFHLVKNDWYMTEKVLDTIKLYDLGKNQREI